jgi:hypothetical protein
MNATRAGPSFELRKGFVLRQPKARQLAPDLAPAFDALLARLDPLVRPLIASDEAMEAFARALARRPPPDDAERHGEERKIAAGSNAAARDSNYLWLVFISGPGNRSTTLNSTASARSGWLSR